MFLAPRSAVRFVNGLPARLEGCKIFSDGDLPEWLVSSEGGVDGYFMAEVKVRDGESIEQALRRFNRLVFESGIMDELKKREFYEKPSEIKKRKKKELEKRMARENR